MKFLFLFPFFLSGLFVHGAPGQPGVIASQTINVSVGEDVILPCNLTPPLNIQTLRVEWTLDGKDVHLYRKGEDDLSEQNKTYKDRTSLFHEEMSRGNISLKLTNVTERDKGKYNCNVKTSTRFIACSITLVLKTSGGTSYGSQSDGAGISTEVIVGIFFGVVVGIGVGIILLLNNRKIRMCAGRDGHQQNKNKYNAATMNQNDVRNDDDPH